MQKCSQGPSHSLHRCQSLFLSSLYLALLLYSLSTFTAPGKFYLVLPFGVLYSMFLLPWLVSLKTTCFLLAPQWSSVVLLNCAAVKHSTVITYIWQHHYPSLQAIKPPLAFSFFVAFFFPQLEDDIIAKPDYIQSIKNFAAEQSQEWMILEFSQLGFIGKY